MLTNHAVYKYETPYKGPFLLMRCWTNGTVSIQYGPIKSRHNIYQIKPYKSDTTVEDINPNNMCEDINILSPVIYFCIILKLGHMVYNMAKHIVLYVNSYRLRT